MLTYGSVEAQQVTVSSDSINCPVNTPLLFSGKVIAPDGSSYNAVGAELLINNKVATTAKNDKYELAWTASETGRISFRIRGLLQNGQNFVYSKGFVDVYDPSATSLLNMKVLSVNHQNIVLDSSGKIKPNGVDLFLFSTAKSDQDRYTVVITAKLIENKLVADCTDLPDGEYQCKASCIAENQQYISTPVIINKQASIVIGFEKSVIDIPKGENVIKGEAIFSSLPNGPISLKIDGKDAIALEVENNIAPIVMDCSSLTSGKHQISVSAAIKDKIYLSNIVDFQIINPTADKLASMPPWKIRIREIEATKPSSATEKSKAKEIKRPTSNKSKNKTKVLSKAEKVWLEASNNMTSDEMDLLESSNNMASEALNFTRATRVLLDNLVKRQDEANQQIDQQWNLALDSINKVLDTIEIVKKENNVNWGTLRVISNEKTKSDNLARIAENMMNAVEEDRSQTFYKVSGFMEASRAMNNESTALWLEAIEAVAKRGDKYTVVLLLNAIIPSASLGSVEISNELKDVLKIYLSSGDIQDELRMCREQARSSNQSFELSYLPTMPLSLSDYLASHLELPEGVKITTLLSAKTRKSQIRRVRCDSVNTRGNQITLLLQPYSKGNISSSLLILSNNDTYYGDYLLIQKTLFNESITMNIDKIQSDSITLSVFYQEGDNLYREDLCDFVRK